MKKILGYPVFESADEAFSTLGPERLYIRGDEVRKTIEPRSTRGEFGDWRNYETAMVWNEDGWEKATPAQVKAGYPVTWKLWDTDYGWL